MMRQECYGEGQKGKKHDVFAKPIPKVLRRLFGPSGSWIELTFRRVSIPKPMNSRVLPGRLVAHQ
jgi:hypothetical protein